MLTKDIFTQKLAEKVKRAREDSGLSQEELAHQAGLYRTYVGHIEKGRYSPSSYVIYKIAQALKIKIGEIFPGQN